MDEPGDHTKWNKSDKDKYHMESLICGIQKMIQMNLFTKRKQTHRLRGQTHGYYGEVKGRDGLGVWNWHVQTAIFINTIKYLSIKKIKRNWVFLKSRGQLIFILIGDQLMYRMQVRLSSTGRDSNVRQVSKVFTVLSIPFIWATQRMNWDPTIGSYSK